MHFDDRISAILKFLSMSYVITGLVCEATAHARAHACVMLEDAAKSKISRQTAIRFCAVFGECIPFRRIAIA
jgi:hypothetical protein